MKRRIYFLPGVSTGWLLSITLGASVVGWLCYQSIHKSHVAENEMRSASVLKRLCDAEADFRENDRDGNGVHDFWTGDIAGLYQFGLIDRATAEADAHPLVPLVPKPIPKDGYLFVALDMDDSERPPQAYRQVTDNKSGKVHHLTKFGFCAYPEKPGLTGNYIWIVNENHSVPRAPASLPLPRNWPSDEGLMNHWSKVQ
jgi:hypothetical protein